MVGSSHVFHHAGKAGLPHPSPTQPMGFWKDWELERPGPKKRQQQCSVLLRGGVYMRSSGRDA